MTGYTIPMYSCVLWHSSGTFQPLKMKPLCCVKMSGTKYPVMQHHIPEECVPHPHHSKKLKLAYPLDAYLDSLKTDNSRSVSTGGGIHVDVWDMWCMCMWFSHKSLTSNVNFISCITIHDEFICNYCTTT